MHVRIRSLCIAVLLAGVVFSLMAQGVRMRELEEEVMRTTVRAEVFARELDAMEDQYLAAKADAEQWQIIAEERAKAAPVGTPDGTPSRPLFAHR